MGQDRWGKIFFNKKLLNSDFGIMYCSLILELSTRFFLEGGKFDFVDFAFFLRWIDGK